MAKQLLSPIPNCSTTTANGSRVSCAGRCLPIRLGYPVSATVAAPVLFENVKHHMEEEEQDWFPKVRRGLSRTTLQVIDARMTEVSRTAPHSPAQPSALKRLRTPSSRESSVAGTGPAHGAGARPGIGRAGLGAGAPTYGSQRPTSVVAVPARRRAQLVQDRALLRPASPLVTRRDRLGHCLPLAHRQSHHRDPPVPGAPAREARATRALLEQSTIPPTRALLMGHRGGLTTRAG